MDQILAKASNQAVSFAIRSGISIASGYAIKTISTFLDKIPEHAQRRIQSKRNKLKTKIDIVTVTIDLIKLAAARGNTVLESSLDLINDLQDEFNDFDERINEITSSLDGGNQKESIKKVEDYMNSLIQDINEAIPILNLVLVTLGVNLNGKINTRGISPGRLLQAANYLHDSDTIVGPVFDLVVYSIFYNPSRLKYIEDKPVDDLVAITWKETYARSSVEIRHEGKFDYELTITEDFNDGRYHDDEDKPGKMVIDLKTIKLMFFTASGTLLRLEGRNAPVLIIKVVTDDDKEEWIALGELHLGEFDVEDDSEDEEEQPAKIKQSQIKNSSLSLLEYLIRLCRLQQIEMKSILEIPDEILSLYLHDELTPGSTDLPKSISQKKKDELNKIDKDSALSMNSNINRLKNLELKEATHKE
ncbi:Ran-specific GTPase-activating protein 30 [Candida viswanathii]|uniref:Ran-specific GTPase-activating protein 30 n=1 Tax=Candida viswanathii TaxID=5486 RepID=A0A367YEI2_9ASCO|nr:Ran-specific GTPase-activating protein 30 [Candida viswanathii]